MHYRDLLYEYWKHNIIKMTRTKSILTVGTRVIFTIKYSIKYALHLGVKKLIKIITLIRSNRSGPKP